MCGSHLKAFTSDLTRSISFSVSDYGLKNGQFVGHFLFQKSCMAHVYDLFILQLFIPNKSLGKNHAYLSIRRRENTYWDLKPCSNDCLTESWLGWNDHYSTFCDPGWKVNGIRNWCKCLTVLFLWQGVYSITKYLIKKVEMAGIR